jgi:hypothetical protein
MIDDGKEGFRCQGTDDRGQRTLLRLSGFAGQADDVGQMGDEIGSRTRRRPIGRDYAAVKDSEVGKKVSGVHPAAGRRAASLIKKRNFIDP